MMNFMSQMCSLPNFMPPRGLALPDSPGLFKFQIQNGFQNKRESKGHCMQLKGYLGPDYARKLLLYSKEQIVLPLKEVRLKTSRKE